MISHTLSGNEGDVDMVSGGFTNELVEGIEIFSEDLHLDSNFGSTNLLFYVKASIVYT